MITVACEESFVILSSFAISFAILFISSHVAVSSSITFKLQVALTSLPSVAAAVTIAVPSVFPVISPVSLIIATSSLLLVHFTALLVASSGFTVATNVLVFPITTVVFVLFRVILSTNTFVAVTSTVLLTSPISFFATTFMIYFSPAAIPVFCVAPVSLLASVIS